MSRKQVAGELVRLAKSLTTSQDGFTPADFKRDVKDLQYYKGEIQKESLRAIESLDVLMSKLKRKRELADMKAVLRAIDAVQVIHVFGFSEIVRKYKKLVNNLADKVESAM